MDNPEPCIGLFKVQKNVIYHYSRSCVYIWNINKFYSLLIETGYYR